MIQLLLIIFLLWVVLAISVGFHANGHNRSTLFWSALTLITGIFGVIIYLLFITSRGTKDPEEGIETSKEFGYLLTAVGGAGVAFVSAQTFVLGISVMTLPPITNLGSRVSPLASTFPLFTSMVTIGGLIGGVLLYHRDGSNRFLVVLSYAPAVLLGLVAFPSLISLVGEIEGLFYGGYRMILAPIPLLIPAALFAEGWRVAIYKIPVVKSWTKQSDQDSPFVDGYKRRKILGFASITTLSFVGYGLFGKNPHREGEIQENKVIVSDGFDLSDLSYGYFKEDNEYRVTGIVTSTNETLFATARIEWFVGTGVGLGTTRTTLDFGFSGNEPAQLQVVVDSEGMFSFEPSEIERFELEIHEQ